MNKFKDALSLIIEKYSVGQLRDRNGKWTRMGADGGVGTGAPSGGGRSASTGGGGGGGASVAPTPFPRTATVKTMTPSELGDVSNPTSRKIISGAISGPSGSGSSLGQIYASVSQATGIPQGRALADSVNGHLKSFDKNNQIKITRETTSMRHGKDSGLRAGKFKWQRNPDGDWEIASIETFKISVSDKKLKAEGVQIKSPHTLGPRPDRFDPAKGGLADQALEFRRKTYADTRLAPQGRFHSASPLAPEMMFGDTRKELAEKGKISEKEAKGAKGTPIGGKYIRKEMFEPKGIDFYDATSSVTAHIGVMTGDENSLRMSKLVKTSGKPPAHHSVAMTLGVKEAATSKPYFTVLSGSKGSLTASDFEGFSKNGQIKEVVKSIWTPGSYGSRPSMGSMSSMGAKVTNELVKGGMKPEKAKQTAQKMLDNFKETSLAQFSPGFRQIIKEAPENFVYENPMSGYRLSFNKHNTERMRLSLKGGNAKSVQLETKIPTTVNKIKTGNGASALFVQNWDSAVMSDLMLTNKSRYTVHDAIGVNKRSVDALNKSVVAAMSKAQKIKPLENLADQIYKQHERNGKTPAELKRIKLSLAKTIKSMRKSDKPFTLLLNSNDPHFQKE